MKKSSTYHGTMPEKKGFMHYLENPAEAAKKIFPFIDIDAMMESNKKRYQELGVDPEMGKNLMGVALNPVALGSGGVASKAIQGLRNLPSGIAKIYKAIMKSKKLDKYHIAKQKNIAIKGIEKDVLSPAGFNRYKNNMTDEVNALLKENDGTRIILNSAKNIPGHDAGRLEYVTRQLKGLDKQKKMLHAKLKKLNSPTFQKNYERIIRDKMKDTKFHAMDSDEFSGVYYSSDGLVEQSARGSWRNINPGKTYKNKYNMVTGKKNPDLSTGAKTSEYPAGSTFKASGQKHKGPVTIDRRTFFRPRSTTSVHEIKHSLQDALRGYIYKAEKLIPKTSKGNYKLQAEAKFMDAMKIKPPRGYDSWMDEAEYLLKPSEISAYLTEFRLNPSRTSSAYQRLKKVFGTHKKIKKAAKDVWAAAPVGLIDYAKKE